MPLRQRLTACGKQAAGGEGQAGGEFLGEVAVPVGQCAVKHAVDAVGVVGRVELRPCGRLECPDFQRQAEALPAFDRRRRLCCAGAVAAGIGDHFGPIEDADGVVLSRAPRWWWSWCFLLLTLGMIAKRGRIVTLTLYTCKAKCYSERFQEVEHGARKVEDALKLVEGGMAVADAAKVVGVTRSAVYQARAGRAGREGRACTECAAILPDTAKGGTKTCSGKCRVARSRRLKADAAHGLAECSAHPAPAPAPPDAPAPTLSALAAEVERIRSMRR